MLATENPTTIFALATPPGRSGVAVLRISGEQARQALALLGVSPLPAARVATFATLRDAAGAPIDQALVLWFPAPASFTGEDIVELHTHGSRAVIARLVELLSAAPGFRLALPGEFTRRALLNGKMDLAEAEGLADLIDAETAQQSRQALHFMQGHASAVYEELRQRLVRALAHLEAYLDFPEEDIPDSVRDEIDQEISHVQRAIEALLAQDRFGEKVRDGFQLALLGSPNVGKSSIINRLAKRDVAIVSPIAGTTRDVIEVGLDIAGYAVTIADTAGLRAHTDALEQEGIRRTEQRMKNADIKLVVIDAQHPTECLSSLALIDAQTIVIFNKCDQGPPQLPTEFSAVPGVYFSAKTGRGMNELFAAIAAKLGISDVPSSPSIISRARHRTALIKALENINNYYNVKPLDLRCEDVRRATRNIGEITGAVDIEELLDEIFRQFCIGK